VAHHGSGSNDRVVANGHAFENQAVTADPHVVFDEYRFTHQWSPTVGQDNLVEVSIHNVTVPRDGTPGSNLDLLAHVDDRAVSDFCASPYVQVCWLVALADDRETTGGMQYAYATGGEATVALVDDDTAPH